MTSIDESEFRAGEAMYYPLFVNLHGRRCLVVGGGAVAGRKVSSLVAAGARVTVVAPALGSGLQSDRERSPGLWNWEARAFTPTDVAGCALAIAATDDQEVNREVLQAAREVGVWADSASDANAGDFIVPAVVRRGQLQLAVSTGGQAPAVAAAVKRRLEELFPEEWAAAVTAFGRAREAVAASDLDREQRTLVNRELAEIDVAKLLAGGGLPLVEQAIESCISRYSE